jgi:hypothetical protein
MSRRPSKVLSWGLLMSLSLFLSPPLARPQASGKGHLIGFVYGRDKSTPAAGAIVLAKNVTTGAVFESTKADGTGAFKVENLDPGIYSLGVTSSEGDFNAQDLVGVRPGETAKVSIALSPYDSEALEAARAVAREEKERGESRVGKVVSYAPASKESMVFIERGLIQLGDRLRIKGPNTDFQLDVKNLKVRGAYATICLSGDQALVPVGRSCVAGDDVYVVCKRGVPPFFLIPLGLALVGGSMNLLTIEEEDVVTPTKPVKIKG